MSYLSVFFLGALYCAWTSLQEAPFHLEGAAHFFLLLLWLAVFSTSCLLFNLVTGCLAFVNLLSSILFTAISATVFHQLAAVNRLLKIKRPHFRGKKDNQNHQLSKPFSVSLFTQYRRYHAETFHLIEAVNALFGRALLALFAIFTPFNTYLVISIVAESRHSSTTTIIMGNVIVLQFFALIFFHLVAVQYSVRLHAGNSVLLGWCAQQPVFSGAGKQSQMWHKVKSRLALANYAIGFHREPSERFGITYGRLQRVMTWATFGNVNATKIANI